MGAQPSVQELEAEQRREEYKVKTRVLCWTLRGYNYQGETSYEEQVYTDGARVYLSLDPSDTGMTLAAFEARWPGGNWKVGGDLTTKVREWLDERANLLHGLALLAATDPIAKEKLDQDVQLLDIPTFKQTYYAGGN